MQRTLDTPLGILTDKQRLSKEPGAVHGPKPVSHCLTNLRPSRRSFTCAFETYRALPRPPFRAVPGLILS